MIVLFQGILGMCWLLAQRILHFPLVLPNPLTLHPLTHKQCTAFFPLLPSLIISVHQSPAVSLFSLPLSLTQMQVSDLQRKWPVDLCQSHSLTQSDCDKDYPHYRVFVCLKKQVEFKADGVSVSLWARSKARRGD